MARSCVILLFTTMVVQFGISHEESPCESLKLTMESYVSVLQNKTDQNLIIINDLLALQRQVFGTVLSSHSATPSDPRYEVIGGKTDSLFEIVTMNPGEEEGIQINAAENSKEEIPIDGGSSLGHGGTEVESTVIESGAVGATVPEVESSADYGSGAVTGSGDAEGNAVEGSGIFSDDSDF